MEALGVRFVPDDEVLVEYLRHYNGGQTLHSSGAINQDIDPYACRPDQLPNVGENRSNYYYGQNRQYANRKGQNRRQTLDGGHWKATDKKKPIHNKQDQIVGYKQNFRFHLGRDNSNPINWVMKEVTLTLRPDTTTSLQNAIYVLRRTEGNRSSWDATNQPLPGSETGMGSSSFPNYTNLPHFLMGVADYLGVNYELPSEFNSST